MKEVYVVHYHEIALKGKNRPLFLKALKENICKATGVKEVRIVSGRIIVESNKDVKEQLSRVFGISSFAPAILINAKYEEIEKTIKGFEQKTFAVKTTRGDKRFAMTSQEINEKLGDFIRVKFNKKVDLSNPDVTFFVEVFDNGIVVYTEKFAGPGGLPVGTQGKALVLLSGGIDSPVAAHRIMKRGVDIVGIHFHSYPFTTKSSIDKVEELQKVLKQYGSLDKIHFVPIAEMQKEIVKNCKEEYRVLLYRRLMIKMANEIAEKEGCKVLVTGESLGQVASQTIDNLIVTDSASSIPVLRPLIGYDKEEIVREAKQIGTYETSIQPHDDCCTLFMPKQVATKARLEDIEKEESKLI